MEHPIKMDDLGVPLFSETAIYVNANVQCDGWCSLVSLDGSDPSSFNASPDNVPQHPAKSDELREGTREFPTGSCK